MIPRFLLYSIHHLEVAISRDEAISQVAISRDGAISKVEKLRTEFNDDPRYKILANIDELKNRGFGEIIQLPKLPFLTTPKGFEQFSSWESYILFEQRINLLKEVHDFFDKPKSVGKWSFLSWYK